VSSSIFDGLKFVWGKNDARVIQSSRRQQVGASGQGEIEEKEDRSMLENSSVNAIQARVSHPAGE
jgi:hypothetical protein